MVDGDAPRVAIVYGSMRDHDCMARAGAILERFAVAYDETVISPHRSPRKLAEWASDLELRGVDVVIAGGGVQASLASVVAAYTALPVIGVPLTNGGLGGVDALLAMTQMASGVPVATVGLDNATNAAILAVQILSVGDLELRGRLAKFKDDFEQAGAT